jgi:hypothetical protein
MTDPSVENGNGMVILRQTFMHRDRELPARVDIVRLPETEGGPAFTSEPFSCEKLDEALQATGMLVTGAWVGRKRPCVWSDETMPL